MESTVPKRKQPVQVSKEFGPEYLLHGCEKHTDNFKDTNSKSHYCWSFYPKDMMVVITDGVVRERPLALMLSYRPSNFECPDCVQEVLDIISEQGVQDSNLTSALVL